MSPVVMSLRKPLPPESSSSSGKSYLQVVRPPNRIMGSGVHRSGWPVAFRAIEEIVTDSELQFDDYVEATFLNQYPDHVYDMPWAGVFHYTPRLTWGVSRDCIDRLFELPAFLHSIKTLRVAITLSEYMADYLRSKLDCPVIAIRHPQEVPDLTWNPEAYEANENKQLLQVGWYLRNTQLLAQTPLTDHKKARLCFQSNWVKAHDRDVREFWRKDGSRPHVGQVADLPYQTNEQFDTLLSQNVVAMELFDASANNGVLDCIVRNTPIMVNRLPAVREYLGDHYPLYFKDPREIPELLSRVHEAHEYLKRIDKKQFSLDTFTDHIKFIVETYS